MAILPNSSHVYVKDCVRFNHPILGEVTAVIQKFFMQVSTWCHNIYHLAYTKGFKKIHNFQDGCRDVYARADVLIDFDTFCAHHPEFRACYLRPRTLVKYEQVSLPVASILSTTATKPHAIVNWNPATGRLENVLSNVCYDIELEDMCIVIIVLLII